MLKSPNKDQKVQQKLLKVEQYFTDNIRQEQIRADDKIFNGMEQLLAWASVQLGVTELSAQVDAQVFVPLLIRIDPRLKECSLLVLEQYLRDEVGKRLKSSARGKFSQREQLLRLMLYMAVNSRARAQFVQRIVGMDDGMQGHLMEHLKQVEDSLESILEVKDILHKVQALEQQNGELVRALREAEEQKQRLTQQVQGAFQEKNHLEKQNSTHRKQKASTFQAINADRDRVSVYAATLNAVMKGEASDYTTIWIALKAATAHLFTTHRQLQFASHTLLRTNKDLHNRLAEQDLLALHLQADLDRLRLLKEELKQAEVPAFANKENEKTHKTQLSSKVSLNILLECEEDLGNEKTFEELKAEAAVLETTNSRLYRLNKAKKNRIEHLRMGMKRLSAKYERGLIRR